MAVSTQVPSHDDALQLDLILSELRTTLIKARSQWPPFHLCALPQCRPHYGLAVIEEELDELRREVFAWHPSETDKVMTELSMSSMRKEAMHTAAMAIAFALEICGAPDRDLIVGINTLEMK